MRDKVKKKLTLKQAAKIISDNIWEHLKTLPPRERKRRLRSGLKHMKQVRLAKTSFLAPSKRGSSSQTTQNQLAARSDQ